MHASRHGVLAGFLIAASALAGDVMITPVPVDSSVNGYSDTSKDVFRGSLAALRTFVARLKADAHNDSQIAAALKQMQTQEIGRTAIVSGNYVLPSWSLEWPKRNSINETGPIKVRIDYNDEDLPKDYRRIMEEAKYQYLELVPSNKVAAVYRIQIEDTRTREKVRDSLLAAFSSLHDAQNK